MIDSSDFLLSYSKYKQDLGKINAENKAAVFAVLKASSITQVNVTFNGEGDSGQIEDILALSSDVPAELPSTTVTLKQTHFGSGAPPTSISRDLREAIEVLCYDFLSQEHDGWENNDGACGEFVFNVPGETIELEIGIRYTETSDYNHMF